MPMAPAMVAETVPLANRGSGTCRLPYIYRALSFVYFAFGWNVVNFSKAD